MFRPVLARVAARARQALGVNDLAVRLEGLERAVAALPAAGPDITYPRGPVYFGDHTALVATRWGAKMLLETRDAAIAPWLALDGLWEAHVTGWLQQTLTPGQIFVDVGANVGYFSLLAARLVGPGGRVAAVEAHPRLAEILHRNVVINGVYGFVDVFPKAAWSSSTDLEFHLRTNFAGNSSAGTIDAAGLRRLGDTEEVVTVEAVTLDDLLAYLPRVDVMKIDVEGAEVHVFRGMPRLLDANPHMVLMFEWAAAQIESVGNAPAELAEMVAAHGFKFHLLETGAAIEPAELAGLGYGNVVATR